MVVGVKKGVCEKHLNTNFYSSIISRFFPLIIPLAMWLEMRKIETQSSRQMARQRISDEFSCVINYGTVAPMKRRLWDEVANSTNKKKLAKEKLSTKNMIWVHVWKRCFDTSNTNNEEFDSASDWLGGNHDSIKGFMTHSGEGSEITDFPGGKRGVKGGGKAN